jgi:hypothetical protein
MLTNAVAGGLIGAAYVTLLVLQLNPSLPVWSWALLRLALTLAAFHGLALGAAFCAVMAVRQLVAAEPLSPGWVSVRLLAWFSAAAASAATVLMWLNLRGFQTVLDPPSARRMAYGAIVLTISALALLTLAVVRYSFGRRGGRTSAALLTLVLGGSVIVPLALRGTGTPPPPPRAGGSLPTGAIGWQAPRVTLVMLDGASLEYISPAAAEGRLPNLGKILDTGATMHLTTIRPTQAATVWTTVATGKYPARHGVRSSSRYSFGDDRHQIELLPDHCFSSALVQLGYLTEHPSDSTAVRARTLWSILGELGISVGVIGWPLTYPAQPVKGFLISDRVQLGDEQPLPGGIDESRAAFPATILGEARTAAEAPDGVPAVLPALGEGGVSPPESWLQAPGLRDRAYARVSLALQARYAPGFLAVRYQGLDSVGHRYLRYAMPRSFGDVSEDERRQFGNVLERYYAFIDAEIGAAIATLEADDLLLVVSGFGMEPIGLGKRLLARAVGDPDLSGTHEGAPGGFLLAYGSVVKPGNVPLGAIVDVAPTVLYYLGLPVARDMDGYARADLFTAAFTSERPVTFVPTYEP